MIEIKENLKTALKLLKGKREHEYGNKKENHENIANLWSAKSPKKTTGTKGRVAKKSKRRK